MRIFTFFTILCFALCITSCKHEEYDLSKDLDLTMHIGGDSLMFPIGSTDTLFASMLLSPDDIEALTISEDGAYAFSVEEAIDIDVSGMVSADEFVLGSLSESSDFNIEIEDNSQAKQIGASFANDIPIEMRIDNFPTEVTRIDNILFENNTELAVSLYFNNVPTSADVIMDLQVHFPDFLTLTGPQVNSNNTLLLNQEITDGTTSLTLALQKLSPGPNAVQNGVFSILDQITITGSLSLENIQGIPTELLGEIISMRVQVDLFEPTPTKIEGLLNITQSINEGVLIGDIPSVLQDENLVLDLHNPHIYTTISANPGFSTNCNIALKPYIDGTENTTASQSVALRIPRSENGEMIASNYYIANSSSDMPTGYTFMPTNLPALFQRIPDSLQLQVTASSDITEPLHTIDFTTTYAASMNCKVEVPLSFGPNMMIQYSDTITGISESISDLLKNNEIELYGEALNKLPFNVTVEITPLDANFSPIPIMPIRQEIQGQNGNQASVTKLSLLFSDSDNHLENTPISALLVKFIGATGDNAVGQPVKEDSFVLFRLKGRLSGGVTVDLEEL